MNHHWAMDRDVLAPGPDLRWHVAKAIDPRRSTGEKELHELAGKSLLLPNNPAFRTDEVGLGWRRRRLSASGNSLVRKVEGRGGGWRVAGEDLRRSMPCRLGEFYGCGVMVMIVIPFFSGP